MTEFKAIRMMPAFKVKLQLNSKCFKERALRVSDKVSECDIREPTTLRTGIHIYFLLYGIDYDLYIYDDYTYIIHFGNDEIDDGKFTNFLDLVSKVTEHSRNIDRPFHEDDIKHKVIRFVQFVGGTMISEPFQNDVMIMFPFEITHQGTPTKFSLTVKFGNTPLPSGT